MAEEGEPAPAPVEEEKVEEPAPAEEPVAEEPPKEEEAPKESAPAPAACDGECPCEMIAKPFKESKFFEGLKEIFMWKDLMKSLAVFCAVNVFFILLICYDFTVLGLICWIAFFALLAFLCIDIMRVIAHFKGEQAESKVPVKEFKVPDEYIDGFFELVTSVIKAFLAVCVNAVLIKNVVFSVSMIFGFLFLIYLAGHMGITGMLYAAILFCFIWFRLYNDHQQAIDDLYAKIKAEIKKQIDQLKEKLNKPKAQ